MLSNMFGSLERFQELAVTHSHTHTHEHVCVSVCVCVCVYIYIYIGTYLPIYCQLRSFVTNVRIYILIFCL